MRVLTHKKTAKKRNRVRHGINAERVSMVAWMLSSLFAREDEYESLLEMTVGELRAWLGVPPGGIARSSAARRALHPRAPAQR